MPDYVLRLANDRGEVLKRVETASSESELRERYAQQGLFIYSIRRRNFLGTLTENGSPKKKIKLPEFLTFNQQFVTLVRAGLPHRILFAASKALRVSEALLDDADSASLYVFARVPSAKQVLERVERLAGP